MATTDFSIQRSVPVSAAGFTEVWDPGNSKRFRLLMLALSWSTDASIASGTPVVVTLYDGATPLPFQQIAYLPTSPIPPGTLPAVTRRYSLGSGVVGAAHGNALRVLLSQALTTGYVRVLATGGEED